MAYSITFVGLVNFFDRGAAGKLLLLPDGTNPPNPKIPPHFANIFVIDPQVASAVDWPPEADQVTAHINVSRFAIPTPSTISFSAQGAIGSGAGSGKLETAGQDGLVPLLKVIDPLIDISPADVAAIARIEITNGELEAFLLGRGSVISRLSVRQADVLRITMTPDSASEATKSLLLRDGAEVVIAHTSALGHAAIAGEENHFQLYGQLDKNRDGSRLKEPALNSNLQQIPSAHPYLAFLRDSETHFPLPGCSVTGCCACCEP